MQRSLCYNRIVLAVWTTRKTVNRKSSSSLSSILFFRIIVAAALMIMRLLVALSPSTSSITHVCAFMASNRIVMPQNFQTAAKQLSSQSFPSADGAATATTTATNGQRQQSSSKKIASLLETNKKKLRQSTRLSLAPMMDYTTRHFRFLIRLLSRQTLLYSEMVAANALCQPPPPQRQSNSNIHSNYQDDWYLRRYLAQSYIHDEGPSVIQLGGSDPQQLYRAAEIITNTDYCSYTAINLNCGCPSPKVAGKGCFGAALMKEPLLVRDLCTALHEGSKRTLPITVKCRIGTDDDDTNNTNELSSYSKLYKFIDTIASSNNNDNIVTDFQIHARIAILNKKLSPAENRKIPKLQYDVVHRLVQDFPHLTFTLNGGIETLFQARDQLEEICPNLAGIMVGRAMVAQPWHWAMADTILYNSNDDNNNNIINNRWDVLVQYGKHADKEEEMWGTRIRPFILKALQGLFMGEPNSKFFRIALNNLSLSSSKNKNNPSTAPLLSELILNAAKDCLSDEVLFRTRQESFELARADWMNSGSSSGDQQHQRSLAVQEWQQIRKEEEEENTMMKAAT